MKTDIAILIVLLAAFFTYEIVLRSRKKQKNTSEKENQPILKITIRNLKFSRSKISASTFYEFSSLLSYALRVYIRTAYKISAMRATSDEIINKLIANASNDWHIISMLAEVLKITDAVKFSRRKLSVPQQRGIYKTACRFILSSERTHRQR